MTPLAQIFYLTAAVAFLAAWVPIFIANRRNQPRRVSYLAMVILYLFAQIILGWAYYTDPQGNPVNLWSGGHGGHHSWMGIPIGYGVPVCVAVLLWDSIANFRPKGQALSAAQMDARTAEELSEQAKASSRKDYW